MVIFITYHTPRKFTPTQHPHPNHTPTSAPQPYPHIRPLPHIRHTPTFAPNPTNPVYPLSAIHPPHRRGEAIGVGYGRMTIGDTHTFITTAKGTPVIRLIQKKTRNKVKIPIMNPNLKAICEKDDYNLPYVVDVILNRYIKEILTELSVKCPT